MVQFGICDKNCLFVADRSQSVVHLYASRRQDFSIKHTVKDINRNILHSLGISRVSPTAEGNGPSKLFWMPLQGIPNTKATHRDATNINTCRINGTTINEAVKHSEYTL